MDKPTSALQENLLVLLCYSDKSFHLIRNAIEPNLFTTAVYRDIVSRVFDFIDQYKVPPKDHLPDLIEEELAGKSGELYQNVLDGVFRVKDSLKEEYILTQLDRFVHLQQLKLGVIKAGELLQQGDPEKAEIELNKYQKKRLTLFHPGTTLSKVLGKLARGEVLREPLILGIPELDRAKAGPARKEVHLLIGVKKVGKTWWLLHLAKRALMADWKVCAITLEVREDLYAVRMIQSLCSVSLEAGKKAAITRFEKDDLGRVADFKKEWLMRPSLDTTAGRKSVANTVARLDKNFRVREFPSGALSVAALEAYLDALEQSENFIPDLLIIDHPLLMKIPQENYRVAIGALYRDLRGIGGERNMAIAVVHHSNREGAKAGTVQDTNISEDWSVLGTIDIALSYSQTPAEYQLGLARMYVSANRVGPMHFGVMISQNYHIGQFCLDSASMANDYWDAVKTMGSKPLTEENGE